MALKGQSHYRLSTFFMLKPYPWYSTLGIGKNGLKILYYILRSLQQTFVCIVVVWVTNLVPLCLSDIFKESNTSALYLFQKFYELCQNFGLVCCKKWIRFFCRSLHNFWESLVWIVSRESLVWIVSRERGKKTFLHIKIIFKRVKKIVMALKNFK